MDGWDSDRQKEGKEVQAERKKQAANHKSGLNWGGPGTWASDGACLTVGPEGPQGSNQWRQEVLHLAPWR